MNTKEVFQLAESKGYYFIKERNGDYLPDSYYQIAVTNEQKALIALTLIQKWLRDTHKIFVEIVIMQPFKYAFTVYYIPDIVTPRIEYKEYSNSYEEALLAGIYEALQLIK